MLRNFCQFAPDYPSLLKSLKDPLNLRASEQIIQFPYVLPVQEEKTEEELARIAEKRKEQGKKLQEMAAKNRQEKVYLRNDVLNFVRPLMNLFSWPRKKAICSTCLIYVTNVGLIVNGSGRCASFTSSSLDDILTHR